MPAENGDNPFGFRPVIRVGGAPFSVTKYAKLASDPQAIFMFDIVGRRASTVALESPGANPPTIASAYDTDSFTVGSSLWQGVSLAYGAAFTASAHLVADEADVIYLAQGRAGRTIRAASHVGKNANISLATAGSPLTKQSGQAVDDASLAIDSTLDLEITRGDQIVPNAKGAFAICEVIINRHQYSSRPRLRRR